MQDVTEGEAQLLSVIDMGYSSIMQGIVRKVVIICFLLLISTPIILQKTGELIGKKIDCVLLGYSTNYQKPVLSMADWLSGTYQKQYLDWVDNNFTTRAFFIKNYNQLRYTLFNEGNRVVANNGNIYEEGYIYAQLCIGDKYNYALDENKKRLQNYVAKLESIDKKLKSIGKNLFFYITPSKAHYFSGDIPAKYYAMQDDQERMTGYSYLKSLLEESNVYYLDANDLYPQISDYSAFYLTGIHWGRLFEQVTDSKIIELLEDKANKNYDNIGIGEIESCEEPFWRDSDVQDLLNIYTRPKVTYYQYDSEIIDENYGDSLRVLLQGGSFSEGLLVDYFNNVMDSSCYRFIYDDCICDNNTGEIQTISDWSDADFQKLLDSSDWVIIELNEAAIWNYSNGFVDYLDEFLNSYVPKNQSYILDDSFEPEKGKGLYRARGYYGNEEVFSWVKSDSCLNLYNEDFKSNGIQINYYVPDQIVQDGPVSVSVYVNGRICCSNSYSSSGEYIVSVSEDNIKNDDDVYSIEIKCDKNFIPSEISNSTDDRSLSLQIKYVGEAEE